MYFLANFTFFGITTAVFQLSIWIFDVCFSYPPVNMHFTRFATVQVSVTDLTFPIVVTKSYSLAEGLMMCSIPTLSD